MLKDPLEGLLFVGYVGEITVEANSSLSRALDSHFLQGTPLADDLLTMLNCPYRAIVSNKVLCWPMERAKPIAIYTIKQIL